MQIRLNEQAAQLTDVYVQDFGDNYHRFGDEPSTELERSVRKIRRRYKDISDYNRAVLDYNEYMALLSLKYGGPELFALKLKANRVDEFIPPMPGIKPTEINKFVMKSKIIVSKRRSIELDEGLLNEVIGTPEPQVLAPGEVANVYSKPDMTKAETKAVKEFIKTGGANGRRNRNKFKEADSIKFLEEYFYTKNTTEAKAVEEPVFNLSEFYDGSYTAKLKDTTDEERQTVFFRGNYIDQESANELEIYKELGKVGWNSMKIMRELGVSKKITNAMKKGDKKDKKKNKRKRESDNLVVDLMTDGNYDSFEDFQKEMESFRASDVFSR